MQNKDSIKNTLFIGIGLCLICAAVISVIAVGLKELQKSYAILDQQKKIVAAADLKGFYGKHGFKAEGNEYLEDGIPHQRMFFDLVF